MLPTGSPQSAAASDETITAIAMYAATRTKTREGVCAAIEYPQSVAATSGVGLCV
jgi:hypothetical protein